MLLRRLTAGFGSASFAAASAPDNAAAPARPHPGAGATPAHAQQTLDILNDPAERMAAVETLQPLAEAWAAAPSLASPAAPSSPAKPATGGGVRLLPKTSREMADVSAGSGAAEAAKPPLFGAPRIAAK